MSAKLYCIFLKDDSLEVIVNSQFHLKEIYEKWFNKGQIKPCLLHIGFDRPVDLELLNFLSDAKKYIFATPSFYHSFPENIEFSNNTFYQLNNMDLKVLISGWFQGEINEDQIDIQKINKIEVPQSSNNNNIIDKKISAILAEYNIINHQEFLDKEKNNASDPQILEIQKKIFLSCRDSFSSFDDFLKIVPFWLKEKSITELMFSVRIENCFTSNEINSLYDLSGFSKNDLISWKNFGNKSMIMLIDTIESLIISGPYNIVPSIPNNPNLNQNLDSEDKEYSYEGFTKWLQSLQVSESTEKKYSRAIQQISMFLREKGYIDSTIFNLKTSEDLKNKIEIYFADQLNFAKNKNGNNMWSAAGNKLIEYFIHKEKKKKINEVINVNNKTLLSEFRVSIEVILSEKEIEILTQRSGLFASSRTLEDIGSEKGVSRERIRQIEAKANLKIMKANPEWCKKIKNKIELLFDKYLSQNIPPDLKYISNSDPYFKGVDEKNETFKYILETFLSNNFFLINLNEDIFLAKLKQWEFNKLIDNLKYKFKNIETSSFENFIDKELSFYSISMMKDLILEELNINAGSFKKRLIQLLEERGEPVHYEELAELYNDKFDETIKTRVIETKLNHYTDVFFCYARGIWGLKEHLNINEIEQLRISNLIERFIFKSTNGEYYQWSSEDLVLKNNLNINEYQLTIILLVHNKKLHYLGRNVWSINKGERLKFYDLALQILNTFERPMDLNEIKEKINERRSAVSVNQINLKSPLILIDQGLYALETFSPEQKQLTSEQKKTIENLRNIKVKINKNKSSKPFRLGLWNHFFEVLIEYYSEHKNTTSIVNSTIYKDTKIGNWLGRQRRLYYKNALPKEFVDKLETSFDDWEWKTKKKITNSDWYEKFQILKNYIQEYGVNKIEWNTIYKETNLGEWVLRVKHKFIRKDLEKTKYLLMEEIFPEWKNLKPGQTNYSKWNEKFELLKQYFNEKKSSTIKTKSSDSIYMGVDLGKWVSKQRFLYSKNKLPSEKIIKLEALDHWVWKTQNTGTWEDKLQILVDYFNEFKTLQFTRGEKYKELDLSIWVSNQKQNFHRNNLSQDRINKIEKAFPQWVWTKKEKKN